MNFKVLIVNILSFFVFVIEVNGQSYISYHGSANYWEHTDLIGYSVGIGYTFEFDGHKINAHTSFGYGESNSLDDFGEVKEGVLSNLYADQYGYNSVAKTNLEIYEPYLAGVRKPKSDNARQIQININVEKLLLKFEKLNLGLGGGIFYSSVKHFKVVDYFLGSIYEFKEQEPQEINVFVFSDQQFKTCGITLNMFLERRIKSNYLKLSIEGAYGLNKTSYASVGLFYRGILKKKKTAPVISLSP